MNLEGKLFIYLLNFLVIVNIVFIFVAISGNNVPLFLKILGYLSSGITISVVAVFMVRLFRRNRKKFNN